MGHISITYEIGRTAGGREIRPAELIGFAPFGNHFGYDTIVLVIELRFRRFMQREEIQHHIALQSGFTISTGSISNLSWLGLAYLEQKP